MKKMLLSMKPYWRDKIFSGEKIYEYRTRFADEEVLAYLYVSQPVCAVTGILHLGRKIYLESWKEQYIEDKEILDRIEVYEARGNKVAMPVISYQETSSISLHDMRANVEGFVAPQSYCYIKGGSLLEKYINEKIDVLGAEIINDIEGRGKNEICRDYRGNELLDD